VTSGCGPSRTWDATIGRSVPSAAHPQPEGLRPEKSNTTAAPTLRLSYPRNRIAVRRVGLLLPSPNYRISADDRVSDAILCGQIKPVPWAPFELAERTDGGGKAGDDVVRNDRRVLRGDAAGRTV